MENYKKIIYVLKDKLIEFKVVVDNLLGKHIMALRLD